MESKDRDRSMGQKRSKSRALEQRSLTTTSSMGHMRAGGGGEHLNRVAKRGEGKKKKLDRGLWGDVLAPFAKGKDAYDTERTNGRLKKGGGLVTR